MHFSVVMPIFNEEGVLSKTLPHFHFLFFQKGKSFEMICVDDGSTDDSWAELAKLAKIYPEIRALRLARNFGHDAALFAGFKVAEGDYLISMDSDGEHPAEVALQMLEKLESSDCDVVNAVKVSHRNQSLLYRIAVTIFGWILSSSLKTDLFKATEFKAMKKRVLKTLNAVGDFHFFYRALVPWIGFRQINFSYEPKTRPAGATHWSFLSLLRFALNGLLLFSNAPMRMAVMAGSLVLLLCLGIFIKLIWSYFHSTVPLGYSTLLTLLLLQIGIILSSVGMLGFYIFATLRQSIHRPRAIVSDQILKGDLIDEGFII